MQIEKIFGSIGEIERGIREIYQCFLEYFYDQDGYRGFWEAMLEGEENQVGLIDRVRVIISSSPNPNYETIGKDLNYGELLAIIDKYKGEIKENLDIDRALKIALHLELIEIQGIFNEIIKLPQEPYFNILSEMHLDTRRNMGNLISGIENFSTDQEFLRKVRELKGGIIERRSGADRRAGSMNLDGADRRDSDRRKKRLVKIVCKI